jgi:hypothetical protein
MNAQNARKYLPLVQALADGKTLQLEGYAGWVDLNDEIDFGATPQDYRIKPEPRTFKVYLIDTNDGKTVVTTHPTFDHRWKQITVQEVLE